ncbi:MAG: hypothetical protein KKI09_12115, partial [Spirochaetes bacterium]|nr:hypothetical protein [Spirochaetota bacterium]
SNGFMSFTYGDMTSAYAAASHPDGSILISGTVQSPGTNLPFLVRLGADGVLSRITSDSYGADGSTPRFMAIGAAGDAWIFGSGFSGSIGYGYITKIR